MCLRLKEDSEVTVASVWCPELADCDLINVKPLR